ncbi:Uncharacterised protein [[Actinobacillus] rossii]|uniref:Lipoprotein n=1 Tax=[Actinobacillus] rossii TaxID=123820 RepID=A0A380TWK9_9PAST|nr:Uncharacterised protein [[Actinobacillus] rossii]
MKKLTKFGKVAALIVTAGLATGCATIVSKSDYPVSITSTPSQVPFEIKNRAGEIVTRGTTPQSVILKAGAGYFKGEKYQVTFRPTGKNRQPQTFVLDTTLDGWYLGGNLIFGGLIGYLIVDPMTGAMYKLPEKFAVNLDTNKTETAGLHIISIDKLNDEQRAKLQQIKL